MMHHQAQVVFALVTLARILIIILPGSYARRLWEALVVRTARAPAGYRLLQVEEAPLHVRLVSRQAPRLDIDLLPRLSPQSMDRGNP